MRSRSKEPKHSSDKSKAINTEAVTAGIKNTGKKLKEDISLIKNSTGKMGKDISAKTSGINRGYIFLGIGVLFFLCTAVFSINFAVNSKMNTAFDRYYEALDSDLIYNGIYLEEVNIGGLTKEQAVRKGNNDYAGARLEREFTLVYGNYSKNVTYDDLGGSYDIESSVNEAYKIGRSGSKSARVEFAQNLEDTREYLVPNFTIDDDKMRTTLEEIASEVNGSVITNSEMDVDRLMEIFEKYMLTNQSNIDIYIPVKS